MTTGSQIFVAGKGGGGLFILAKKTLPPPYTPPEGDEVYFELGGSYTPPEGDSVDFDLGDDRELNTNSIRRIFFSLSLSELLSMLDSMLADLKKHGVNHRDINPGNILWSEKERTLKYTDFFWSDLVDHPVSCPGAVNQIYTIDDEKAIEKIKDEINEFFNKLNRF